MSEDIRENGANIDIIYGSATTVNQNANVAVSVENNPGSITINNNIISEINEALIEIAQAIELQDDGPIKIKLKSIMEKLRRHCNNNKEFVEEMKYIGNIGKIGQRTKDIMIIKHVISYLIWCTYFSNSFQLPQNGDCSIVFEKFKNWIFNPTGTNQVDISKLIPNIVEFVLTKEEINNGNCILADIKRDSICSDFPDCIIDSTDKMKILPDFFSEKQYIINIASEKKLTFKCGKCAVNLAEEKIDKIEKGLFGGI